jgi:hypothetical protein
MAIVVAKAYPDPSENTGRRRKKNDSILESFPMVHASRLAEARVIVRHARELADLVLADDMKFSAALDEAQRLKGESEKVTADMARLRAEAPDLAALVDEGATTAARPNRPACPRE